MQNCTDGSGIRVQQTSGFLHATATFFSPFLNSTNTMFETQCELSSTCNVDQYSMKAYLARYLANISHLTLFAAGRVGTLLRIPAIGAAAASTTSPYGNMCGLKWYINRSNGTSGLSQQLSAVKVMYALLVNLTEPQMRSKNLRTRSEQTAVRPLPLLQGPPSSPTKPLYDADNEASKISRFLSALLSAFALATLFAMNMVWSLRCR